MDEIQFDVENYTELFELFGHELFCVVCQGQAEEGERILEITNCKHMFHETCLEPWLRQKGTCPLCRRSVLGENHRQFLHRAHLLALLQIVEQQILNERRILTWILCDGILRRLTTAAQFQTERERCEQLLRNFAIHSIRVIPVELANRNRLTHFAGQIRQQLLQTFHERTTRLRNWTDVIMMRRHIENHALMNPEFQLIWQ